ncbi:Heparan-sulfate 6-O-sulfotransferase 3-B [Xenoophorus captivus]|uniref:Heparan-sulfate 6-O-sulfotransferase n=1 Tax=Xenoophorus captivus TaxID=1517983 RepID=A0ABV0RIX6_9TELE
MDERSSKLILVPILAVLFVMIGYQYICPAGSNSCHFKSGERFRGVSLLSSAYQDGDDFYRDPDLDDDGPPKLPSKFNFTERDLDRHVEFNIKGDDVIVFLHIQKTGGTTFGRHLVRNIRLEQPCDCKAGQKKCICHRPGKEESWLFSRFSTGWSCGLHADWTELTNCVPVVMDKKEAQRNKRKGQACQAGSVRVSCGVVSLECAVSQGRSGAGRSALFGGIVEKQTFKCCPLKLLCGEFLGITYLFSLGLGSPSR